MGMVTVPTSQVTQRIEGGDTYKVPRTVLRICCQYYSGGRGQIVSEAGVGGGDGGVKGKAL